MLSVGLGDEFKHDFVIIKICGSSLLTHYDVFNYHYWDTKADSRIRIKCALLGQTCHMFLLYLQPQKNRPFWCFRNIILCSVRHPTHVCTLGALECADRAIAEFMLSTPGTKRQSSLAPIGTFNKNIIVSGGGWTIQERGCGTHTACNAMLGVETREGRVHYGTRTISYSHVSL